MAGSVRRSGSVRTVHRFTRFAGSRGSVHAVRPVATKSPRHIKAEIVTKVVAVRAGNFSIGPFCTEFRCEQLCDDGVFQKGLKIWPVRAGSVRRFAPVRAGSVHAVRRFVPVRFVPVRRFVPFVPVRFVPVRFWRFRFGSRSPWYIYIGIYI